VTPLFKKNPKFQEFYNSSIWPQIVVFLILKAYTFVIAGYCLIPFVYLSFHKWWAIYKRFYFIGHIIIVPMSILWKPLIVKFMKIYFPFDKKEEVSNSADTATISNNTKHEKEN
jgi:lysophospholipid acyltransferase 5